MPTVFVVSWLLITMEKQSTHSLFQSQGQQVPHQARVQKVRTCHWHMCLRYFAWLQLEKVKCARGAVPYELRLNRLHLSLTHEVQCWTAIGSGIKNGDDVSSRSGKTSLPKAAQWRGPRRMFLDAGVWQHRRQLLARYYDSRKNGRMACYAAKSRRNPSQAKSVRRPAEKSRRRMSNPGRVLQNDLLGELKALKVQAATGVFSD